MSSGLLHWKRCPHCGRLVDYAHEKIKYCYRDGFELVDLGDRPKCDCGRYLSTVDKYCENCGKYVEPQTTGIRPPL